MTAKRSPNAIQVNGAYMFVRDPEAASGSLFANWRRLGGLGSFTLPAEAGSTTETALMDGAISFANVAGVGNISGAVGALNAGAVHQFMEDQARTGGQVQCAIIRFATDVASLVLGNAHNLTTGATKRLAIPVSRQAEVKAQALEGMIVGFDLDGAVKPSVLASYTATAASALDDDWQGILEIGEDGDWIDAAPGYSAALATTAATARLFLRNPGRKYLGITASVNQWDRGDFQAGGGITSNLQLVPSTQLATFTVEHRLESEVSDLYTASNGWDNAVA